MAEPEDEVPEEDGAFPPEPEALSPPSDQPVEAPEPQDVAPEAEPEPEHEPELVRPPPPPLPQRPPRRRRGLFGRLLTLLFFLAIVAPVAAVAFSRFAPPLMTPLMMIRLSEGRGWDYRWRPISRISPSLVQAAVAAEDARFCAHHGFDFTAMRKALAHNERRPRRVRGGSTISQQTAKNVFLWPARSYVRKGLEAYFTVLTELIWGKRRIMEVYLNVAEWGPGIYGAQAAAERYFGVDASDLTPQQASRLAAILPSPLKWKPVHPGRYVARRSRRIVAASGTVRSSGLAACVLR
jgi:monofunctional biosynthetic peptidoglycan transglycosylase